MSRVAKKPIPLPKGVDVKIDGQKVMAKGPKGQLDVCVHPLISVKNENGALIVTASVDPVTAKKKHRVSINVIAGTTRANLNNLIVGVVEGYMKKLVLVGVGYRVQMQGKNLGLSLGFSHPTKFSVPADITIETPSQTEIIIKGLNKHLVGQVAAKIRALRSVESYKGKGIRYSDEWVKLKETKKKA